MTWVRQKTTRSYIAVVINPRQAFEILPNIPEPRRTLVLTDAATALRVSEVLGLMWLDLNFEDQVIQAVLELMAINAKVESCALFI
jgi:integrase